MFSPSVALPDAPKKKAARLGGLSLKDHGQGILECVINESVANKTLARKTKTQHAESNQSKRRTTVGNVLVADIHGETSNPCRICGAIHLDIDLVKHSTSDGG